MVREDLQPNARPGREDSATVGDEVQSAVEDGIVPPTVGLDDDGNALGGVLCERACRHRRCR